MDSKEIKLQVKNKYGEIALQSKKGCGCGDGSCCSGGEFDYTIMSEDYTNLNGYVADADMGLGCGLPTQHARIKPGDTVVDLGAGAGNDAFVARSIVGNSGHVIGIDMTDEMVFRANLNNQRLGYKNVEFKLGEIEDLPIANSTTDVVVSNCVLNLVPDKQKAFNEIYRILKPGGHFCISDIVLEGNLPDSLKETVELYAGCVSGAIQKEEYTGIIKNSGFINIEIKSAKKIDLPDALLTPYLTNEQLADFKKAHIGIFSITVVANKAS